MRKDLSYSGRSPASAAASARARAASLKAGTRPEEALSTALRALGLRFRCNVRRLPGVPDFVFLEERIAVFVDGDFWHGRKWAARRSRLAAGHNADYWIAKIERNMARDRDQQKALRAAGWKVLRFWESVIRRSPERVAVAIERRLMLHRSSVQHRRALKRIW